MGMIGKTVRFTLGLAIGAGIGAAAAMLVDPQSGMVDREQIRTRLNDVKKAGQEAQHKREHELQTYWEQEINVKYDDPKDKNPKEKK